jgi:hypothetical protein
MRLSRILVLSLWVCLIPTWLAAQSRDQAGELPSTKQLTYLGYNPSTGQNNLQQTILYVPPSPDRFGIGPFPLAIWLPGTFASYIDPWSLTMMSQMALRGFVSASIQYNNINPVQYCEPYVLRAQSVFDITRASSAINVLCSTAGVDCGKGVVVYGISQGAAMALLAKNYAPAVRAVYAMSIGDFNSQGGGINLAPCLDDNVTAISSDRVTVVNGESDNFFQGQAPIMGVSGITCPPGTFQCWSPTGSGAGWYIVKNSQVADGVADHCYPIFAIFGYCTSPLIVDPYWYLYRYNWSMAPNLDWLATLGTKRVFSSTNQ